ncbi:exodeoxyribonuclease VII large subunit [Albibacterium indicum]|uniref:exodeoxyribonuclease VII large subunit n=1 Tax=Albibacterium indicum TaxID=2292082 RepID=UPI000E4A098F|nr:exodeoxyribonuclease VII large subunit [Pedobacter indicus]
MEEPLQRKIFSLSQVATSIQKTLAARYQSAYWVKAEINKLNHYSHSGHCYPDLVEKKEGKVIAEMRSILWKSDFYIINQRFLDTLQEPLKDGIMVLMLVNIAFDPVYGISLRILDIDPSFSLGELAKEKQASIARLQKENIFNANKALVFPVLPKRLAIISVETSKGYADFVKIIDNNPYAYKFEYRLFPALLQGDKAVQSIVDQLKSIEKVLDQFDAVAIIRGGGGEIGLACYNHYELAKAIATFPLPVLTGIGHSTNETVSEMVAFKNAITPSELADMLIQRFHEFAVPVVEAEEYLKTGIINLLKEKNTELDLLVRQFQLTSQHLIRLENTALSTFSASLRLLAKQHISTAGKTLDSTEVQVKLLSPENVLKRGFSLTYQNGIIIKNLSELDRTVTLTTKLHDGEVESTIIS